MVTHVICSIFFLFTSALLAPFSFAQAEPHGWTVLSKRTSIDVKHSIREDVVFDSINLRTTNPDEPEVRFSCSEEFGLRVTLLLQPLNDGILDHGTRYRAKERFARLAVEGREPQKIRWVHLKEVRAMQSRTQKAAKMIYNAAVEGRSFVVKEPFKKNVAITMPPMDDAFREFARTCVVTNGS
jgi:hypothetical protein